jgi:tetratricopeptide (TPR) repeat protein
MSDDDLQKLADKIAQVNLGGSSTQIINNFVQNPPLTIPLFPNNLDALSADEFIGRDDDLLKIHEILQGRSENRGKPLIITAVAGMSGVGKSELARQYAYKYQQEYPGGICWLAANLGKSQILTDLSAFMLSNFDVQLEADATNWPTKQIAQYFWQRWQTPGNILLIFDDVKQYADIQDFLPSDQRFRVLSTSQIDFTNNRQVEPYPLEVLRREKSLELLEYFIGSDRINQEAAIANQLCDFLGDLPLGLDLAGRYLKEFANLPLSAYWQRLQSMKIDHQSLDDANHPNRSEQTKRGVMTAFQVTWERIGEIHPNSQELAVYFSLYAPAPIPVVIDHENYDQSTEETEKSLNTLLDWHIMKKVSEHSYRLHNLMREFLQKKLTVLENGEELKRQFLAEMINVAQYIKNPVTNEIIQNVSPYIEHLTEVANNYVTDLKTHFIDDLTWPYTSLGRFYEGQGLYNIAQDWQKQCLDVAKENLPVDHDGIATSYNNLAELYRLQGKYEEAEPLLKKAIAIGKKTLSTNHPDLATWYNNLANLYYQQGKYEEAELLYKKAIAIDEKSLPTDHPNLATYYGNLANLYNQQEKYEEAELLYKRAITIGKKTLSADHPSLACNYNNLAGLYSSQGKYEEAEPLLKKAIIIGEKSLHADHPNLAISYNNLANLHKSQGKYEEAELLYKKAIAIDEKSLPTDHPQLASHYNNLAELYESQRKYEEVEPLYKKAIAIDEKSLPADHPQLASHYNNLAGLYITQGKYEEAEPLYKKAIAIDEKFLPADHRDLAIRYNNLALLYKSQGKYEEAEPFYLKAFEIFMNKLGIEHPNTQKVKSNLIKFWQIVITEGRAEELKLLHEHPLRQWFLENNIDQE